MERIVMYNPLGTIERIGYEANRTLHQKHGNISETVTIGGKTCNFRSQGEKKLAYYLQMLKDSGHIKDWAFEQTTFHFPDDRYLVDFDVLNNDGTFEYYEWKGLFDERSRRKIRLLSKYRPEVQITLVFPKKSSAKKVSRKMASCCKRVCVFSESKGLIDYQF